MNHSILASVPDFKRKALSWNSVEHILDRRKYARQRVWSDAPPPPHGHAAVRGEQCERSVFRAKRKRERVSAKPIERRQEVTEAMFRGAERSAASQGASEPAVDTCCLSPVWTRAALQQYSLPPVPE